MHWQHHCPQLVLQQGEPAGASRVRYDSALGPIRREAGQGEDLLESSTPTHVVCLTDLLLGVKPAALTLLATSCCDRQASSKLR